jgi:rhamnosyltransferase
MSIYVSIIIPTKNAGNKLDAVLKGIFKNKVDFEYEVIIIDSGSKDNTKDIISKYPVRLIEIEPLSFSHGRSRNIGAEVAKGEILVYLTQDAIPADENWLSNLVKGFKDSEVAGIFGRQIPDKDTPPIEKFFLQYLYPKYRIIKYSVNPYNCSLQDIFFSNANSALRKYEWKQNKFREDLIMSEDQAWAKDMLVKKRKIIYEPEAMVYHSHHYSLIRIMMRNFDSGLSLKGIIKTSSIKGFLWEIKYIKSAIVYFFRSRYYKDLFKFPFYELFRLLGFFLGTYSQFLPMGMRKALSQNKVYWEQIKEK